MEGEKRVLGRAHGACKAGAERGVRGPRRRHRGGEADTDRKRGAPEPGASGRGAGRGGRRGGRRAAGGPGREGAGHRAPGRSSPRGRRGGPRSDMGMAGGVFHSDCHVEAERAGARRGEGAGRTAAPTRVSTGGSRPETLASQTL